ncbi:MAG: ChbG/HpnK family deacetylase [Acidobacteriota bacterium]|nr:ChbG/HpnK family deacetylase [Acidobacteriota bacterium]
MPARLILNADDFGLTPGINRAVAELHTAGVLTSATLMANGPAFQDAIAIAHALPTLRIGAHIVLTDGAPVSDPARIPTLLGPDRHTLRPTLTGFLAALLLRRIREDEIEREALAQIRKIQNAGIPLTHIDTHKHTHIVPAVLRPLLRAAARAGVPTLRYPFEPRWSAAISRPATPLLRRLQLRALRVFEPTFRTLAPPATDGTLGIAATGHLNPTTLRAILHAIPQHGAFELCCHPGYHDDALSHLPTRLRAHRDIEREALLTVIPERMQHPNPPRLIHYESPEESPDDSPAPSEHPL